MIKIELKTGPHSPVFLFLETKGTKKAQSVCSCYVQFFYRERNDFYQTFVRNDDISHIHKSTDHPFLRNGVIKASVGSVIQLDIHHTAFWGDCVNQMLISRSTNGTIGKSKMITKGLKTSAPPSQENDRKDISCHNYR